MNKKVFLLLASLIIIFFVMGCGAPAVTPPIATDQNSKTPNTSAQTTPGQFTVTISNNKFDPVKLDINKGDTVTWINQDSVAHTATGKSFDSGTLANGAKYSFTFQNVGAFDYICTLHPYMKAAVTVK